MHGIQGLVDQPLRNHKTHHFFIVNKNFCLLIKVKVALGICILLNAH
jgi:hypothetical protein